MPFGLSEHLQGKGRGMKVIENLPCSVLLGSCSDTVGIVQGGDSDRLLIGWCWCCEGWNNVDLALSMVMALLGRT